LGALIHLATHETNYLSQKNKISSGARVKGQEKVGNHGGNCGYTSNLCTYPGLLAPSGWTDYDSGTGAGLVLGALRTALPQMAAGIAELYCLAHFRVCKPTR
jgi:hypothetical protein